MGRPLRAVRWSEKWQRGIQGLNVEAQMPVECGALVVRPEKFLIIHLQQAPGYLVLGGLEWIISLGTIISRSCGIK